MTDPIGSALRGEWAQRFERTLHKKLSVITHHEHIFPNTTSMRALYDECSLYVQEINHLDNHCVSIGQTSKQRRVCSAKGTLKRLMCNILYTACSPTVTAELQLRHKLEQKTLHCAAASCWLCYVFGKPLNHSSHWKNRFISFYIENPRVWRPLLCQTVLMKNML